jgi:uncharacterized protein
MPWALRMVSYAAILLLIFLVWFGIRYWISINKTDLPRKPVFKAFFLLMAACFLAYPIGGHLQYQISGSFDREGFPLLFIYTFWYGLVFTGVMLNWLIIHDVTRPVVAKISKLEASNVKKIYAKGFLIISLVMLIWTATKMVWDTNRIITHEMDLSVSNGFDGEQLTVVHIADLHADIYTDREKLSRYITEVNKANPDIVIVAGDLITSGRDYIQNGAEALGSVESAHGVFFVMGDHDYWTGTDYIEEALEANGVTVLQNDNRYLTHNNLEIKLTGITELYSYRVDVELLDELMAPDDRELLHIVTAHQASERLIRKSQEAGSELLLTGHTHGGQINIPLFFMPLTAVMEETPYVKGPFRLGELFLNVNSGLGFTLSPVRYNAPATVSVIRVKGN